MRVLVIGGTGPTGPHVLNGLLSRGHEVAVLHRGVHEPPDLPHVEHIHADPHFEETLGAAVRGRDFDIVLGMYGRLSITAKVFEGRCRQLVGVTGTAAYENALEPLNIRPGGMRVNAREDGPVAGDNGPAPYFSGKVAEGERAVLRRAAAGAYQATVVRYPKIYGPRNPVPYEWSVIKRVQDGRKKMFVMEGGHEIASRCASQNAAHLLLLTVDKADVANGQIYNCSDEQQFSSRQWIDVVAGILGSEMEIISLPVEIGAASYAELNPMPGQFSHRLVDISKARMQLGYADAIPAREAIANYVQWLIDNPPKPGDYPAFIDPFDYAAEDRLLAAYQAALASIPEGALRQIPRRDHAHSMPHPKTPA